MMQRQDVMCNHSMYYIETTKIVDGTMLIIGLSLINVLSIGMPEPERP